MAKKNIYNINVKINEVMNQVETNSITPAEVKEVLKDLKDSYANLIDHIGLFGLREYDESRSEPYAPGEASLKQGRIAVSKFGYSGVFDPQYFNMVTPKQPLYELPAWNSQPKALGYLARFEGNAYKNTVANNTAEPPTGWDSLNVSSGYFGEVHQTNTVYVENQVVFADFENRKLYLRCISAVPLISLNIKTEWEQGKWEYYAEAALNPPVFMAPGTNALKVTDHGKVFMIKAAATTISLKGWLPSSFFCDLVSVASDGSAISFTADTNCIIISAKGTSMQGLGAVKVRSLGEVDEQFMFQLSGDLTP